MPERAISKEGKSAVSDDNVMDQVAGQDVERLLLCAQEAGGDVGSEPLAGLVGGDARYARELVGQLVGLGLAHPSSYDGELHLNGRGRQIAARIAASLADGWRRDDLTRRWVLESARAGERFSANDLSKTWGAERGRSADEIQRAISVLAEHRLIEVIQALQGTIVMGIEQRGRDALERSIVVRPASVPTMVVNNNNSRTINQHGGAIGGVQLGDHSTQHNAVTLGDHPSQVSTVLQRALEHVDGLPSPIAETVRRDLSEAILETNTPEPRMGFIRDLAQRVIIATGTAAGTAAGGAIFALVGPLAN